MKKLFTKLCAVFAAAGCVMSGTAALANYSDTGVTKTWDFAEYTQEVACDSSSTTDPQTFSYEGLTISLANNASENDHDKISTSGVYWRGAPSGKDGTDPITTRYIAYTPTETGTLYVTGTMKSGGRWGVSTSLDVNDLKSESSTTSSSETTVQLECKAGTTYYIFAKNRSLTVKNVTYTTNVTDATAYEYTNDPELAEADAKGWTADVLEAVSGVQNPQLTWYIKDGSHDYKKLTTGDLPTISADSKGGVYVGLIVYNIPAGVSADTMQAGYAVSTIK